MHERDAAIIQLTYEGISASKIKERLGLIISVRQIQRVQQNHLGNTNPEGLANSALYQIGTNMRPYIEECLGRLGKNPYLCENCGERQKKKCEWHHTKYEGCTIYDLVYVCLSCNRARANVGLQ